MEFGPSGPDEHGWRKRIDENDVGIEGAQGFPNAWVEVDMTRITDMKSQAFEDDYGIVQRRLNLPMPPRLGGSAAQHLQFVARRFAYGLKNVVHVWRNNIGDVSNSHFSALDPLSKWVVRI